MDVTQALVSRRMVRSFDGSLLSDELVASVFDHALRVPTAGNAQGISWITLLGHEETALYFDAATDPDWRSTSARYLGLSRASAIGICLYNPDHYVARYAEADKVSSGLGENAESWPVPYWIGDAGASCLAALLVAESLGLQGCFLGAFRNTDTIHKTFAIPKAFGIYGAVLLGRSDGNDHRSPSLDRNGVSRSSRIHRRQFS